MKFEIPPISTAPPTAPPKAAKPPKPPTYWEYDPETPLPKSVVECDDIISEMEDRIDADSSIKKTLQPQYEIIANHANKLVGWDRYKTSISSSGAKLFFQIPTDKDTPKKPKTVSNDTSSPLPAIPEAKRKLVLSLLEQGLPHYDIKIKASISLVKIQRIIDESK